MARSMTIHLLDPSLTPTLLRMKARMSASISSWSLNKPLKDVSLQFTSSFPWTSPKISPRKTLKTPPMPSATCTPTGQALSRSQLLANTPTRSLSITTVSMPEWSKTARTFISTSRSCATMNNSWIASTIFEGIQTRDRIWHGLKRLKSVKVI